jgi:hypothetical protein
MMAFLALIIWIYLYFLHGKFWQSGPELAPAVPPECPDVDIIVPARDEAVTIAPVIASHRRDGGCRGQSSHPHRRREAGRMGG